MFLKCPWSPCILSMVFLFHPFIKLPWLMLLHPLNSLRIQMSGDACSRENTHNYQGTHAVEKYKNLKLEHACSRENTSNRCQGMHAVEKTLTIISHPWKLLGMPFQHWLWGMTLYEQSCSRNGASPYRAMHFCFLLGLQGPMSIFSPFLNEGKWVLTIAVQLASRTIAES